MSKETGIVKFPGGLVIADGSQMRSGLQYDIDSLNIDSFDGTLTADHNDKEITHLIGKVHGLKKVGQKLVVDAIEYAVNANPLAKVVYDLTAQGFSKGFSIGTIKAKLGQDGKLHNGELFGLSQVILPDNYNTYANAIVSSFKDGQSVALKMSDEGSALENIQAAQHSSNVQVASSANGLLHELTSSMDVKDTTLMGKVVSTTPEAEAEPILSAADVTAPIETEDDLVVEESEAEHIDSTQESIDQLQSDVADIRNDVTEIKEAVTNLAATLTTVEDDIEVVQEDIEAITHPDDEPELEEESEAESIDEEDDVITSAAPVETITPAVEGPLTHNMTREQVLAMIAESNVRETEPAFQAASAAAPANFREALTHQFNLAVKATRDLDASAYSELREINKTNYAAQLEAGKITSSLKLEDLGNFIVAPEVLDEVQRVRTNYTEFVNTINWKDGSSMKLTWLNGDDEIDMVHVETGAYNSEVSDSDLQKPTQDLNYTVGEAELEEVAKVTGISLNTLKYAAVDILGDITRLFSKDYDRKRAQLLAVRFQEAVTATGQTTGWNPASGLEALELAVADAVEGPGYLVMNTKTLAKLKAGAIAEQAPEIYNGLKNKDFSGTPIVTVSSDILPTIGTAETRTFAVWGVNKTVTAAIFFYDPEAVAASATSLEFDVDGRASYTSHGVLRSAFENNEVAVRGSFLRAAAVTIPSAISAISGDES